MTLDTQLLTMISMVIGGIYLGFATETFRRIAVVWKNKKFLTYSLEIMYWVSQTCILFIVLFRVNEGELRVYIFLACLLGFSMYTVIFKTIYQRILEWIIKGIVSITRAIIKLVNMIIFRPVTWIAKLLLQIIVYIGEVSYKLLLFILRVLFYPLRILLLLFEKLIPEKLSKKISQTITFCSTIIYKFKRWLKSLLRRGR